MSTSTEFLNLVKPSQNDTVDVSVFNNNADILDAKLSEINTALEESSSSAGGVSAEEISEIRNMIKHLEDVQTGIFEPRNLTTVFATEISSCSDEWAWLKSRATNGNFSGLQIGDYIVVTTSGFGKIRYMIAAFDHYYQKQGNTKHHIVMIPSAPLQVNNTSLSLTSSVQWNTQLTNNTSNNNGASYIYSNLHSWEINTFLPRLPEKVQSAILSMSWAVESRYNSPTAQTDSTETVGLSLGKIWSPSEIEVFGTRIYGSSCTTKMDEYQFPIFSKTKIADTTVKYWLRTLACNSSTEICAAFNGSPSIWNATSKFFTRPCLLVG